MALLAAGCATGPKLTPEHKTTGGPLPGHEQLPPGPWTVDTMMVTDSCGAGAGLLLTQLLKQRGYRIVSTGTSTRAEITCQWSDEDVPIWKVDTARAKGECVAEDVRSLSLLLRVVNRPYQRKGEAEAVLTRAEFEGRARLEAEPPHRGCVVRREDDTSLLARGLRSVGARIPEGAQKPPPLVAPAPAGADVVVGEAGPGADDPVPSSIYPVDFGDRPAPDEALSADPAPSDGDVPKATHRKMASGAGQDADGGDLATGPLITRQHEINPLWRRFDLTLEATTAACTDFCDELYAGGLGPGLRLLFHAHELLALEVGWRRIGMETRDRVRVPDDVQTVLTDVDIGGRLYVGDPGGLRGFGGLGVAFTDLGDEWEGAGQTEGTRFSGFASRLLMGLEVEVLSWLRLGANVRYDRVDWEEVCDRSGACDDVGRFHPISGSDIWSGAGEISLGWP